MIAVKIPATAGYPDAKEIARHRGKAIRKTKNPDTRSCRMYFGKFDQEATGTSGDSELLSATFADMEGFQGFRSMKAYEHLRAASADSLGSAREAVEWRGIGAR
jgi:hypothetical protein